MPAKKLSRRRGTPFYRHRDAWAKYAPLLSCMRRLYDAGGKAWDKIRDHQKFIKGDAVNVRQATLPPSCEVVAASEGVDEKLTCPTLRMVKHG